MCQAPGCALGHGGEQAGVSALSWHTRGVGCVWPVEESGNLSQELTQELSPEGCVGIGEVRMGELPGGGNSTAEARGQRSGGGGTSEKMKGGPWVQPEAEGRGRAWEVAGPQSYRGPWESVNPGI